MKRQRQAVSPASPREPSPELVFTLTSRLKEALSEAETTDFRALDRALFEGVTSTQLEAFSRDLLHRQLVFALAETVLSDSDAQASDWVVEAVRLFLTRLAVAPALDLPSKSTAVAERLSPS